MRIYYILILALILLIPEAIAAGVNITLIEPSNTTVLTSGFVDFSFSVNMTCNCSLFINNTFNQSINMTSSGIFTFASISVPNGDYNWNVSGFNHSNNAISGGSQTFEFSMAAIIGALVLTECPTGSTAEMLILWLIVLISLFFLWIGFTHKLPIMGFFGAIMFMVTTWFLAGCQPFFAFVCALFSFILIIWFAVAATLNNTTFR